MKLKDIKLNWKTGAVVGAGAAIAAPTIGATALAAGVSALPFAAGAAGGAAVIHVLGWIKKKGWGS